jgi:hypothetical protein
VSETGTLYEWQAGSRYKETFFESKNCKVGNVEEIADQYMSSKGKENAEKCV